MVIAKILWMISNISFALIILTGHSRLTKSFFQSYFFYYIGRTMHLQFIIMPIIAKSYQASLLDAFVQVDKYKSYLWLYAFIASMAGASLLFIFIQSPIDDMLRFIWYKC